MSAPTVPRKISALLENMFTQQEVIKTKVGEIWRASGVSQSRISLLPHSAGTDGVGNGVVVDVTRGVTFQGAGDGRGHRRHYGSSRCVRPFRSIQTGRTSAATDRSWGWWALMRAGNSIWATAQLDLQMLRRTSRIASGRSSIIHFGQLDKTQLPDSEEEKKKTAEVAFLMLLASLSFCTSIKACEPEFCQDALLSVMWFLLGMNHPPLLACPSILWEDHPWSK